MFAYTIPFYCVKAIVSRDTISLEAIVSRDTISLEAIVSRDTISLEAIVSRDTISLEAIVSRDTISLEAIVSRDAALTVQLSEIYSHVNKTLNCQLVALTAVNIVYCNYIIRRVTLAAYLKRRCPPLETSLLHC